MGPWSSFSSDFTFFITFKMPLRALWGPPAIHPIVDGPFVLHPFGRPSGIGPGPSCFLGPGPPFWGPDPWRPFLGPGTLVPCVPWALGPLPGAWGPGPGPMGPESWAVVGKSA